MLHKKEPKIYPSEAMSQDEHAELTSFLQKHPHIKTYLTQRNTHPTLNEMLLIINHNLSLKIFELNELAFLIDLLPADSDAFMHLAMLPEEAELINRILEFPKVKSILEMNNDNIRKLLSLSKDQLNDLRTSIERNSESDNISKWLNKFSEFSIQNNLQPKFVMPGKLISKCPAEKINTPPATDKTDTPPPFPEFYQDVINNLTDYTTRIEGYHNYSSGFKYFIEWQSKGREANYHQAITWLKQLNNKPADVNYETHLKNTFNAKQERRPKRWVDFFGIGITSKQLSGIEKVVMCYINNKK